MTHRAGTLPDMTHATPADRDVSLDNCEAVCVWFGKLNCAIVSGIGQSTCGLWRRGSAFATCDQGIESSSGASRG